jgi:hypothetical protein
LIGRKNSLINIRGTRTALTVGRHRHHPLSRGSGTRCPETDDEDEFEPWSNLGEALHRNTISTVVGIDLKPTPDQPRALF